MIFKRPFRFIAFAVTLVITSSLSAAWQQPPYLLTTCIQGTLRIASDANGHAFVILTEGAYLDAAVEIHSYDGTAWSGPVATFPISIGVTGERLGLAMNASGKALAIWADEFGINNTAYFDGTSWTNPPGNPLLGLDVEKVAIDINDFGQGVAVWIDNLGNVSSSFFSGGSWGPSVNIGTGDSNLSVAYSRNGTAVAGWQNLVNGVTVNNYFSGSWQAPIILDPFGFMGIDKNVDIDARGRALAIWIGASGNIISSTFNGLNWLMPQVIDPSLNNVDPSLSMAPGGTAVAIWKTNIGSGFSSSFNGNLWSSPIQFTAGPIIGSPHVSVNKSGNALAAFGQNDVNSASLPLGASAWTLETIQDNLALPLQDVFPSLSDNGRGFAAWTGSIPGSILYYASVTLAPTPPLTLQGNTCKNRFATHEERVNIITFTPSTDPSVVSYNLRRNGILIATIPATGPFVYYDSNRCKNEVDVYSLTSRDLLGQESTPIVIEL